MNDPQRCRPDRGARGETGIGCVSAIWYPTPCDDLRISLTLAIAQIRSLAGLDLDERSLAIRQLRVQVRPDAPTIRLDPYLSSYDTATGLFDVIDCLVYSGRAPWPPG